MTQNNTSQEQFREQKYNPEREYQEHNYKELVAWQKAHSLVIKIYDVTTMFPKEELLGLTGQIKNIAPLIPALLVEGYVSNNQEKYIDCLDEALGKLAHLEYLLLLAKDVKFLPRNLYDETEKLRQDVNYLFFKLLDSIRRRVLSKKR